jgi:pimeloyl-ACP methyl ester carboxylesterase
MSKAIVALAVFLSTSALWGQTSTCQEGVQGSGAIYLICMPDPAHYNGQLVIFAHGYVDPRQPVGIPYDQILFSDGSTLPEIVNSLGFGFAMSSYSLNGWAVKQGIADTKDLIDVYSRLEGRPSLILLTGASEGGLIAAKSAEMYPGSYAGALSVCGIVGDFPSLINYTRDWRIVWDYFFPGLIPGTAIDVPQTVIDNWDTTYKPAIAAAIASDPTNAQYVANAARISYGGDPANLSDALLRASSSVLDVNDAVLKFGGQPYDNVGRVYTSTNQNLQLNWSVPRYAAAPAAIAEMNANYQTTGSLPVPVVTMHTLADPLVPYWQETLYAQKIFKAGSASKHTQIPINRYGHCNFTTNEIIASFAILFYKVTHQELAGVEKLLRTPEDRAYYKSLVQQYK